MSQYSAPYAKRGFKDDASWRSVPSPRPAHLSIPSPEQNKPTQSHLRSPVSPNKNSVALSNETLMGSSGSSSSISSPTKKTKYRSSFSTRKNMHQARQLQQMKYKEQKMLSLGMTQKTGGFKSAAESQWAEKKKIKDELNKRLKARLGICAEIHPNDREAHIEGDDFEDEEDEEPFYETEDQHYVNQPGTQQMPAHQRENNPMFPDQTSFNNFNNYEYAPSLQHGQQYSNNTQLPPMICEQPPTPPGHGLPLSYRESFQDPQQFTNQTNMQQQYYQQPHYSYHHSSSSIPQHQTYFSPRPASPQPHYVYPSHHPHTSPYPHHTVVVYQYGPPPPFLTDMPSAAVYHTYNTIEQQHLLPIPGPHQNSSSNIRSGTLSSTLVRSPSPASWLGPSTAMTGSPAISTLSSGGLRANGDVKIISRSSSCISIGALVDPVVDGVSGEGVGEGVFGFGAL
ncbi:hypothetical protein BCR33DRAFT_857214 [Rhizoclosmatium globosum]|uniref:Uncharacterized protein n=1 Tax=Rhizoclosmatium globosum TaxID=329046 RepID=A0A1Y2B816_9FUNG|nr:hypothetical protein BCR33DRAFT_857214 [Rhizoclosmatium globosum]|eukprot:ORY30969.1 hypothetical protein BCR33DRAFT_857214 [Rhizoclosmatium globosum]